LHQVGTSRHIFSFFLILNSLYVLFTGIEGYCCS